MSKISLLIADYDAVIFDMDGTMVDNMPYHARAWEKFLELHNVEMTMDEFHQKFTGRKNDYIMNGLFETTLSDEAQETLAAEKEQLYRDVYTPEITEVAGLNDLVEQLKLEPVKLVVATTAPRLNRELVFERVISADNFDLILGSEDVQHGKPNPEIYHKCAEMLGLEPSRCLVFEDSPVGVEAAKAAGMRVVGVLPNHSEAELPGIESAIDSFQDIDFK